jgi:hypothetical protein
MKRHQWKLLLARADQSIIRVCKRCHMEGTVAPPECEGIPPLDEAKRWSPAQVEAL